MNVTVTTRPIAGNAHVWRGRLARLLVLGLLGLPVLMALEAKFPLCVSAGLFGLPCPGCGLTRASVLFLQGDFGAALKMHPLVLPMAPLYFGALALLAADYVGGPHRTRVAPSHWLKPRVVTGLGALLLVALIGLWLARFVGFFGGPAPVETYKSWAAHRASNAAAGAD